jgi:hypothetical protein
MMTVNATNDWLSATARALGARFPHLIGCSDYISQRLSSLLLQRLPPEEALELLAILPATLGEQAANLRACALGEREPSIGYPDFVERAVFAIGCSHTLGSGEPGFEPEIRRLAQIVADEYLWTVTHDLSDTLKRRLARALPLDLASRMDLATASDAHRVA